MGEKVLVTGCNGYIALHVLDILLSEGYHVIGTARSEGKGDKVKNSFAKLYPPAKLDVEVVTDISQPGAFDAVFKKYPDLQHVVHMAANFSFGSDQSNEETYLIPSTEGTKSILNTVVQLGPKVKTFVQTSSFAAIRNEHNKTSVHTEATWNPVTWEQARTTSLQSYCASKKLAEKLGWDFVQQHASQVKFNYTAVCPPYVLGPQMFGWGLDGEKLNTSAQIVNDAVNSTPSSKGPFDSPSALTADVRDVALLHMLPLRSEKLAGQRLIPVAGASLAKPNYDDGRFNPQRILDVINARFPELKGKIAAGNIEDNKKVLDKSYHYNTDLTCKLTGVEFKSFETTVVDSVKQILEHRRDKI
ncbi:uncharacterized protein LALA0_S03e01882g [Lachancea lanzarotensis]|uniref:LALA0S03e01882g1_1 n=1 Tax=Lachancea lanzarotensis TaxID=1245769 RepID=A0A0C7N0A5_9SACH|nr:uncharacterized protein LALA0_S03e01882g [Lachancea lanzarotensis]CEP61394.1 LALA0S03e01882g1_1 [Lachancea lanzarotensis]